MTLPPSSLPSIGDTKRRLSGFLARFHTQLNRAYRAFNADDGDLLAGGIAFFSVLSLAPTLMIALAFASRMLGGRAVSGVLVSELRPLLGDTAAAFVAEVIGHSNETGFSDEAALIGAGVTMYASTRLFIQVQAALNRVWGVSVESSGPWYAQAMRLVKKRALSFALVLGLGVLLALTAVAKALMSYTAHHLGLPDVPVLWRAADLGLSFFGLVCVLAAVYRVLPDLSIGAWHALRGGFITAVLLTFGALIVGAYLDSSVVASAFGAAGSLVVFMLSAYYGALIFLFGAELTAVYAREEGALARDKAQPPR